MPEYLNPHPHDLHLLDQNGKVVTIGRGKLKSLPDFFDRYVGKHLQKVDRAPVINRRSQVVANVQHLMTQQQRQQAQVRKIAKTKVRINEIKRRGVQSARNRQVVGKVVTNAEDISKLLDGCDYPVSNNIGVGILSYNRRRSLQRLISSIIATTDLNRTTVFVSDDCSTDDGTIEYLNWLQSQSRIVVVRNSERLGVAGNSNRLLRCLQRFKYKLLLNDDVEIIERGWDRFYADAMAKTGMHHFCYREPGVYGAAVGESMAVNGVDLTVVSDRPHGAVMAFDTKAFDTVGYFDEGFGLYGMEHVDWSTRVTESGLQKSGFYDVSGSSKYFIIHPEQSAVESRQQLLKEAKQYYGSRVDKPTYVTASEKSDVPTMSCVIPFKNSGRDESILTVVNNIRGQKFPAIEIIMVEHDTAPNLNVSGAMPIEYKMVVADQGRPFNKSIAFNVGVKGAHSDHIVLHDADTLAPGDYFKTVWELLLSNEACHLGAKVYYADGASTANINNKAIVDTSIVCDRVVGYFEGGSLACHKSTYWKIGGFNEDFWGYGCEDCEFYERLAANSVWAERRTVSFVHLSHGRTPGWGEYHDANKKLHEMLKGVPMMERVRRQHTAAATKYHIG